MVDVINSRNGRTLFRQECQTSGTSRAPSPTSNVNMLFVCRGANSVRVRFFCLQLYLLLHVFIDEGNSYEFLKTTALFIDLYYFYGIMYT